ncbi:hypothetical protein [Deinococcus peraridilitoris]|uniref:Holliday junction resolvase n=1 Tax=Deinococcus peraridilitoris (strain DSM 19664 / LMG 22246 / CIP 109416 / KR-200) TaxID=937777 RepID=K9ZX01_DEIPD|nr:hypothetical protein [Deinococcus peraridilitoris]AFZ66086.1 hypothetical protein Deipe_0490 [Deinococcus peraridilitoris DSM 19664]
MPVNGCLKGKEGEREVARALTALGHPAERGQQHAGGQDSPDVKCPSLNRFHLEVKFTKTCQLFSTKRLAEWDAQAKRDAGPQQVPVVVHRWNGQTTWWCRVLRPGREPVLLSLESFVREADQWGRA